MAPTASPGPPGWCWPGAAPARRASARNGCARWRKARGLTPSAPPHIALIGETEHDAREVMIEGPAGLLALIAARRAAALDPVAPAAGMAERRGRPLLFGGGPRAVARAAVRRRLVRRARQVAPRRRHLRHAAVRPAAGRAPAPARHHHAAADPAHQAPRRRPAHGGDARRHAGQRRVPVADVPRRGAGALCRHAAGAPGDRRRDHRGPRRRAVDAGDDRGGARGRRRRR